MNEFISIGFFSDSKYDRLIDLSKTTYDGREISDPEYLFWEYSNNPDGQAIISIAETNGNIISQYLVIPRNFSIDNKIVRGSLSVNTLTHHDYRDKGLFTKLANETFKRCREDGIEFTIGFPNPLSLPVIEKKKIFETMGYLPFLYLPLKPIKSVLKYLTSPKEKTGKEIELLIPDKIFSTGKDISFFDFQKDKEKYSTFLEQFNREKQNVTFRSLDFLKWRYSDIPFRKYYIFKLENDDGIKALAVFRARYLYGMRCGILVDIAALENIYEIKDLFSIIKNISAGNQLDLIISTVPAHSPEYKYLKLAGFFSLLQNFLPQKLALIVQRHLPSASNSVTDFRKWFLTFGDYDIF